MVYKPRHDILENDSFFHLTWQCHDKKWHFADEWIKRSYYDLLMEGKERYSIIFFSYHIMENHVHLVGQIGELKKFSDGFRFINSLFVRRINKVLERQGQMVMNRFKTRHIKDEGHLLATMAYIDLNGVRAGRDKKPEDSLWSSYKFYAYGKEDSLITPAPTYFGLGSTTDERQKEYKNFVRIMSPK